MDIQELKQKVFEANLELLNYGLVTLTWGNVSGIDRTSGIIVIKPSGINYKNMVADDMVALDLNGKIVDGTLRPSSDTPTHIELYKSFPEIGGISHTHSMFATMFAQAHMEIPCYGTTHADHFFGDVPLTRLLTENEVNDGYEKHTGSVITERFKNLDPKSMPGVLVASHAPFTWGKNVAEAVKHSLILERISELAYGTLKLNKNTQPIKEYIKNKHYNRKHGADAYYGQNK